MAVELKKEIADANAKLLKIKTDLNSVYSDVNGGLVLARGLRKQIELVSSKAKIAANHAKADEVLKASESLPTEKDAKLDHAKLGQYLDRAKASEARIKNDLAAVIGLAAGLMKRAPQDPAMAPIKFLRAELIKVSTAISKGVSDLKKEVSEIPPRHQEASKAADEAKKAFEASLKKLESAAKAGGDAKANEKKIALTKNALNAAKVVVAILAAQSPAVAIIIAATDLVLSAADYINKYLSEKFK